MCKRIGLGLVFQGSGVRKLFFADAVRAVLLRALAPLEAPFCFFCFLQVPA